MKNKSFSWKGMGLANRILVGMVIGLSIGFIAPSFGVSLKPIGDIFMNFLRMAVVPLIYCNVVYGIAQMGDLKTFGRAGSKLVLYFFITTFFAVIIGSIVGIIMKPGIGMNIGKYSVTATAIEPTKMTGFFATIMSFIPKNALAAFSSGNLPQIIVFALFTGGAILLMKPNESRDVIVNFFGAFSKLMLKIIIMVMELAPYGIGALMAWTSGKFGVSIFGPFAKFTASIYIGLIAQVFFVYILSLYLFTKITPIEFLVKTKPIWLTSIATCSSAATVPISLKIAEEIGLPKKIYNFSIPLGATMNMDGNAIWFGVMGVFASNLMGLPVSFSQIFYFAVLGVVLTLGSPGIPGGIFVATTIFLSTLGLPLEAGAIMMGIFRIMDMGITTLNLLGDVAGTFIVSRSEKLF